MTGNMERDVKDIYLEFTVNKENCTVGSKSCRPFNVHHMHEALFMRPKAFTLE